MMSAGGNPRLFPREQPASSRWGKRPLSVAPEGQAVLDTSFWFILTLIPCLLLVVGACALVVWAIKQRDSQSKLVEKLTVREKKLP
jgi:hypothetical protein